MIFVVSTTGQGDVPDSMKVNSHLNCIEVWDVYWHRNYDLILTLQEFWKFLLRRNLGHQWLHGLHFAVFGLGDSGYQKYNVRLFMNTAEIVFELC